jgi:FkbM family methyltransferase
MNIVENMIMGHRMFFIERAGGIHKLQFHQQDPTDPYDPREPEFNYIWRREITPDMIVVDVGANIGYNTLIAASIVSKGKGHVYAIEPDPRNSPLLKMAVEANGYNGVVGISDWALSDKIGEIDLHLGIDTNLSSITKTKNTKNTVTVQTMTLTDFMADKPFPNMIKMDTEGAEVEIIAGALKLFTKHYFPVKILIEVHPQFYTKERDFYTQLKNLLNLGFRVKYVNSAGVPIPDLFKEKGYKPIMTFTNGSFHRGLYDCIPDGDAIYFASTKIDQMVQNFGISPKIVRSIMFERK